jgi:hypothetical protein
VEGMIYQYTHLTSFPLRLIAHCSKHPLWILFPQAALHQTISSVSGSNSVKQIGQSPLISLRFLLDEVSASETGSGA